jgi:hypothetical protein
MVIARTRETKQGELDYSKQVTAKSWAKIIKKMK